MYPHKQLTVYRVKAPKVTKKYPLIGPSSDCEVFILRADSPYLSSRVYNYLNKNLENGTDGEEEACDLKRKKGSMNVN